MRTSVVVGSGANGRGLAQLLAGQGERVKLVSRSGSGPRQDGVELIALDGTDADALTAVTEGASTLFNCAMPPYDRWPQEWPPLARGMLTAAERTGADYVMLGNTYGYGAVDGPMTPDLPMTPTTVKGRVRTAMWMDALAAHEAGRIRVAEIRASDFLGAGAASVYVQAVVPEILAGRPVAYPGSVDVPHSWSAIGDVVQLLAAVSRSEDGWGRAWHVPSTSVESVRALTRRLVELAGAPEPVLTALPYDELVKLGETDSIMAELVEMWYLDAEPHVLDATETVEAFGLRPAPVDTVLTGTLDGLAESGVVRAEVG